MADSTLFGNTAQPQWMAPEQRDRILGEEGRANARSFDSAFQAAYGRDQEEKLQEKLAKFKQQQGIADEERTKSELKPIIDHAKGLADSASWLKVNQDHPEYMLNPRTQPYWMELGKNLMGADVIKQKSLDGQMEIQRAQEQNDWNKNFGLLSPDEKGQVAKIIQDSGGKLNDRGWRVVNGKPIGPDDTVLSIVDQARKREGYSAFGMDKSERLSPTLSSIGKLQAERQRAVDSGAPPDVVKAYDDAITKANVSPLQVEEARQAGRDKIVDKQIAARSALETLKQNYRIDLGKLGLNAGKSGTEDEFVKREFKTIFDKAYTENENSKNPRSYQDVMADVDMALHALYKASQPAKPKGEQSPPPADGSISFDDFQSWKGKQ